MRIGFWIPYQKNVHYIRNFPFLILKKKKKKLKIEPPGWLYFIRDIVRGILLLSILFWSLFYIFWYLCVFHFWMVKPFKVKTSKTSLVLGFKYTLWTNQQHQYTNKTLGKQKHHTWKNMRVSLTRCSLHDDHDVGVSRIRGLPNPKTKAISMRSIMINYWTF